jgi:formyltetrahydrofolate deformylase
MTLRDSSSLIAETSSTSSSTSIPIRDAFFMRLEWSLENFTLEKEEILSRLQPIARRHEMQMRLHFASQRKRIALFVTKENHCLYDLLARHEAGDLPVDIPLIVANHDTLRPAAERFGIPFHHFPITKENKLAQEAAQIDLLKKERIDTVVLARYMQIISPAMIAAFRIRSSTSTTASCQPSWGQSPTIKPTHEA